MKNKLGIFTALILSLVIAGSAFALPGTSVSAKKLPAFSAKANKASAKKKRKHHRHHRHHKRKFMKRNSMKSVAPKK